MYETCVSFSRFWLLFTNFQCFATFRQKVKKSENLRKCRKIADIAREGRFLIGNLAIFGRFFRFFSFLRYFYYFCDFLRFLRFFAIFVIFLKFCNFLRFRRCEAEARRRLAAALMLTSNDFYYYYSI